MKKIISLVLVLVMIMTLAVSASATDTGSSTIVVNGNEGILYSVYRVLNAKIAGYEGDDRNAITYTFNENFINFFFSGEGTTNKYVSTTNSEGTGTPIIYNGTTYYLHVTGADFNPYYQIDKVNEGGNVAAFAADLIAYIKTNGIRPIDAKSIGFGESQTTFSNLDLGYYLVDSGAGALCALTTNNQRTEITEKNEAPTITKTVSQVFNDNSQTAYSQTLSVSPDVTGVNLEYKVQVTVGSGSSKYEIRDSYNANYLSLQSYDVKFQESAGAEEVPLVSGTDFTVYDDRTSGRLWITITDADYLKKDAVITIYLTMLAPEFLPVDGAANKAFVVYGDDTANPATTPEAVATVYSSQIEINKYADGDTSKALKDAVFVLKNDKGEYAHYSYSSPPMGAAPRQCLEWSTNKGYATPFTTDAEGKATISGLANGTYYLEEITAPAGYNLLAEPVEVVVEPNTDGENVDPNSGVMIVKPVENKSGAVLPSTGGMGTTLFYILGSLMAVGALVVLVTNKRVRV